KRIRRSFWIGLLAGVAYANIGNWFLFPETLQYSLRQRITLGGFSFFFGVLAFLGVSALFLYAHHLDVKFWMNQIIPSVLLFHLFGRIGCSLAGCCYGIELSLFGFHFDFPARELEAFALFILYFVFQKGIEKHKVQWYLFLYALLRFGLEFGRGDDRGQLPVPLPELLSWLSPAQAIAIIIWAVLFIYLIVAGILRIIRRNKSVPLSSGQVVSAPGDMGSDDIPEPPRRLKWTGRVIKLAAVAAAALIWWNPLHVYWCDSVNLTVAGFAADFQKERSRIAFAGEGNGGAALPVREKKEITSEKDATDFIHAFDNPLNGSFQFDGARTLPTGSTVYSFTQLLDGLPICRSGRHIVVGRDNTARYLLGETAPCPESLKKPEDGELLSLDDVIRLLKEGFIPEETGPADIHMASFDSCWYPDARRTGGQLYAFAYEMKIFRKNAENRQPLHLIIDARTGELYELISDTGQTAAVNTAAAGGMTAGGMAPVVNRALANTRAVLDSDYQTIIAQIETRDDRSASLPLYYRPELSMADFVSSDPAAELQEVNLQILNKAIMHIIQSGQFSKTELIALFSAAAQLAALVPDINFNLLRDILILEGKTCSVEAAGIIREAFGSIGIYDMSGDRAHTVLDIHASGLTVGVRLNYPGEKRYFTVRQDAFTAQSYFFLFDRPVNLSVCNAAGDMLLTRTAEGEDTFTIYPTFREEQYIIIIQTQEKGYPSASPLPPGSKPAEHLSLEPDPPAAGPGNPGRFRVEPQPVRQDSAPAYIRNTLTKIESAYENADANAFIRLATADTENDSTPYNANLLEAQIALETAQAALSCANALTGNTGPDSFDRGVIANILFGGDSFSVSETVLENSRLSLVYNTHEQRVGGRASVSLYAVLADNSGKIITQKAVSMSMVRRSAMGNLPLIGPLTAGWYIDGIRTEPGLPFYNALGETDSYTAAVAEKQYVFGFNSAAAEINQPAAPPAEPPETPAFIDGAYQQLREQLSPARAAARVLDAVYQPDTNSEISAISGKLSPQLTQFLEDNREKIKDIGPLAWLTDVLDTALTMDTRQAALEEMQAYCRGLQAYYLSTGDHQALTNLASFCSVVEQGLLARQNALTAYLADQRIWTRTDTGNRWTGALYHLSAGIFEPPSTPAAIEAEIYFNYASSYIRHRAWESAEKHASEWAAGMAVRK
ncbi:MAG: prolipoprotein diacylglyceryl transferase, partial [Oscillospiraceae bacterium]|nr:prolipoprotein diacylglyceryl transferase [Oscillospiraceae bacterium]